MTPETIPRQPVDDLDRIADRAIETAPSFWDWFSTTYRNDPEILLAFVGGVVVIIVAWRLAGRRRSSID